MFPSKRARHNRNPDSLINHGTSAQFVRAEATEHLSGDAPPRQPGTMPQRTLTREFLRRLGSLALVPVVVAVLGGIIVAPAAATSQDLGARHALLPPSPAAGSPQLPVLPTRATQPGRSGDQPPDIPTGAEVHEVIDKQPHHLRLKPTPEGPIELDQKVTYQAFALAKDNTELGEVTGQTDFSISQPGQPSAACPEATCTPTKTGKHTVTGRLRDHRPAVEGTATLEVIDKQPHHLRLKPTPEGPIELDQKVTYQAFALAKDNTELGEVTGQTDFSISQPGQPSAACPEATCTPTKTGKHTVTGRLRDHRPAVEGTATLEVIDKQPHHLRLKPTPEGPIELDQKVTYQAFALAKDNTELGEVTGQTDFSISQPGQPSAACPEATCTPTKTGKHTVTGRLRDHRPAVEGTATLEVIDKPTTSGTTTSTTGTTTSTSGTPSTNGTTTTTPASQPVISSVQPGFTFAGMSVDVSGNTGSCSHAGIVTFHGNTGDVSVNVTADQQGNFVARVTIPKGTFPNAYQLELTVDCNGQLQRAQGDLSVLNIAPTAANDSAKPFRTRQSRSRSPTTTATPIPIPATRPWCWSPAPHLTAQPRPKRTSPSSTHPSRGSSARTGSSTTSATTSSTHPGRPTAAPPPSPSPSPTPKPACLRQATSPASRSIPAKAQAGGRWASPRRSTASSQPAHSSSSSAGPRSAQTSRSGPTGPSPPNGECPRTPSLDPAPSGWPRCAPRRWPRRRSKSFHRG